MALPVSNKAKRLSLVALTGGVLTLVFSLIDAYGWSSPPTVVAAVTSLSMLLAGFYDWKRAEEAELYDGEHD